MHEINYYCPNVKQILVACKKDLRNDPNTLKQLADNHGTIPISYEEGYNLAQLCKFDAFIETSALKNENVTKVHHMALTLAAHIPDRKQQKCTLM